MSRYIKSDATDDFIPGKMDSEKEFFVISFHIKPNGFDTFNTDAMKAAGETYLDGAYDAIDIVDANVTSSGLTTVVVKNNPAAIAQLISDIRTFEKQAGYSAWFFHFKTTDDPEAKPVGIWSNSLSNSEWQDNDIETIDRLIQEKMGSTIESSRQIKSSFEVGTRVYHNDGYNPKGHMYDSFGSVTKIIDDNTVEVRWDSGKTEERDVDTIYKVNSSRQIKSARYIATDPETGEVLGSADTYEEAVDEWGEDVTITDSEVGDGMDTTQGGILSSKESNHQFNQRIVNSVLTKEITEDDAIKQIASRNNMNIGFAKRIFNNLMEDKSLIQSGVMEMADDINKDFDLNGDLYSWFDDYVEDDGKSTTVGGELVRAAHQIIERFENDGDKIGMGYGKETVNPAARYILAICNDYIDRNDIEEMLYNESRINYSDEEYDAWIQQFERTFEDYLRNHEELFHAPNKNDMWDYKEEDDVDSSVTECCIYDDNGNEYWFQKDEDSWKCTNVEYTSQSKYKVNDYVDDLYDIPDTSDDFCDFELDGFEYSAERASNGEDWIITNVSVNNGLADVGDVWSTDDFNDYTVYDANGREINVSDLY